MTDLMTLAFRLILSAREARNALRLCSSRGFTKNLKT
jgi:hypothetical protein